VGQGLSGTVDMQTVRPLSYRERVLSVNYRWDQNRIEGLKEHGNRYSFSYIDQFMDNRLGVALGYAHLDSPQPGFQNEAWGYADPDGAAGPLTGVLGGGKAYRFDDNNERDGWLATLQFKPNDFYEGTLDVFYSKFKKTEIKHGVEFGTLFGPGIPDPNNYESNGVGTVTESHWTNIQPVIRSDSNPISDHLRSIGFNNKFHVNDHWDVELDWSHSRIHRDMRFLETYGGLLAGQSSSLDVLLNDGYYDFVFGTDLNDPDNLRLVDAGGWGQDGYLKDFEVEDRLHALRLDATREFDEGFLRSIEFGVNRTSRDKVKSSLEYKLCIEDCVGGDSAPFPGTPSDFGLFGIPGFASFDAEDILDSYNLQQKFHQDIAGKNWEIDEDLTTWYLQANIDTDWGSVPVRGNIGFQWVDTDQSSSGFFTVDGNDAGDEYSDGDSYKEFLPSLNLSWEFPHEQYLRFGAARQMARPRLDYMRASFNVDIANGDCRGHLGPIWCGSRGNPRLRPWLANAYDLSYEKYFSTAAGNKGYVSAAYFYKHLNSFVVRVDREFDYAGFALPDPAGFPNYPASTVGRLEEYVNGDGGTVKGLELTVSIPLDVLWSRLDGFGIQASYSDTKSSIHPLGSGGPETPLPGLSKYISNVTAYYEHAGFSIRYSRRTRSAFLGEDRAFGADLGLANKNAEVVEDAQVNYDFHSGWAKGLSLYLQVSNIGDEPSSTFDTFDPEGRPLTFYEYGRTTLLGFSYKF
jgi:iron complex outermembrane receptor protein